MESDSEPNLYTVVSWYIYTSIFILLNGSTRWQNSSWSSKASQFLDSLIWPCFQALIFGIDTGIFPCFQVLCVIHINHCNLCHEQWIYYLISHKSLEQKIWNKLKWKAYIYYLVNKQGKWRVHYDDGQKHRFNYRKKSNINWHQKKIIIIEHQRGIKN